MPSPSPAPVLHQIARFQVKLHLDQSWDAEPPEEMPAASFACLMFLCGQSRTDKAARPLAPPAFREMQSLEILLAGGIRGF